MSQKSCFSRDLFLNTFCIQGILSFLLFLNTFRIQGILSFLLFLDTFGKGWKVKKLYYKVVLQSCITKLYYKGMKAGRLEG